MKNDAELEKGIINVIIIIIIVFALEQNVKVDYSLCSNRQEEEEEE